MKRIKTDSNTIPELGYDGDTKLLEIKLHTGAIYHYREVDQVDIDKLAIFDSVGKWFNQTIRTKYEGILIGSEP